MNTQTATRDTKVNLPFISHKLSALKELPVNLVRSYPLNQESYSTLMQTQAELQRSQQSGDHIPEEDEEEEEDLSHETILLKQTETLRGFLLTDEVLYLKCRDFSYNFEWVLVSLQVLSPPIDEKGMAPRLGFRSLHFDVCTDSSYEPKYFPCYIIELDKFMKIISHVDARLTKDEVVTVANAIECLDQHPKYGPIVIYDKLVLAIRNATLSKEEIQALMKNAPDEGEGEAEQQQQAKPRGTLTDHVLCSADGQTDINIDSKPVIETNQNFTPKHIEIFVDRFTNKIIGITIEYMDLEVFQVTTQNFERDGGFNSADCEKYVIECEPEEEFVEIGAAKTKGEAGEFISYLEFHTSKGKELRVGKIVPESSEINTHKIDPNHRLKGFVGMLSDSLVSFGIVLWEPMQGV